MAQSLLTTNSLSQKCTKKAKIEIDFFLTFLGSAVLASAVALLFFVKKKQL
jgi:hypothetical protein